MIGADRSSMRSLLGGALCALAMLTPTSGYSVSSLTELEEAQKACLGTWGAGVVEIQYVQQVAPRPGLKLRPSSTPAPAVPPVDIQGMINAGVKSRSKFVYRQDDKGNIRGDFEELLVSSGKGTKIYRTLYFVNGKTIVDFGPGSHAEISSGYKFESDPTFLRFVNLLSTVPFVIRGVEMQVPGDSLLTMGWQEVVVKETDKGITVTAKNPAQDRTAEIHYVKDGCILPLDASFNTAKGGHEYWTFEYQQVGGVWYLKHAAARYAQNNAQGVAEETLNLKVDVSVKKEQVSPVEPPVFEAGKRVIDTETRAIYSADKKGVLQPLKKAPEE